MAIDANEKRTYHPESQHTLGHIGCLTCEATRVSLMLAQDFSQLTFRLAFPCWIESRTRLSPASISEYHKNFKRLESFFGDILLSDIHAGHIREYVNGRKPKAGASRINHEISTLQQVLKRAALWQNISAWYEPLALPRTGPGIALEPDEEAHLFRVAAKKSRWQVAFLASVLTNNTTAGPTEIRRLQLKDVSLAERMIYVRDGAKNKHRVRSIPLNEEAMRAVIALLQRAKEHGSTEPDHYLIPSRNAGPLKPMESWKKAWYSLRKEAGKLYPRLAKLRRYDLRHHCLTRLLEHPDISEQVIRDIAGHVSNRMLQRYSHIRTVAKRDAVESLCTAKKSAVPVRLSLTPKRLGVNSQAWSHGQR